MPPVAVVPPVEARPPDALPPVDINPPALVVPPLLVAPPCPDEPPVATGAGVSWEQLDANATARTKDRDRPVATRRTYFMIESLYG
jgi:hypothetical protein